MKAFTYTARYLNEKTLWVYCSADKTSFWWINRKQKLEVSQMWDLWGIKVKAVLLVIEGWEKTKQNKFFVVQVLGCLVCLIFEVDTSHIVELTYWMNMSVGSKLLTSQGLCPLSWVISSNKEMWISLEEFLNLSECCGHVMNSAMSSEKLETMLF